MTPKRRATIKQVARLSGVSTQTVSRVLNERPDVAAETRRRVQQVIAEIGYSPSAIARSLIQGRSFTLGVVAHGLDYYGPSRTLVGIEREANHLGYSVLLDLLHHPEPDRAEKVLRRLLAQQVDGVIWAVPEIGSNRAWLKDNLLNLSVPLVFTNMQPRPGTAVVAVDNLEGGRIATEHLLAQGRRRIGIITGPLSWWEGRQRELGWQSALAAAGVEPLERFKAYGDWTPTSGDACMRQLLEQSPDLEAVFVCNDQMALGAVRVANELGRCIPQDLALVGFDDIPEAAYFVPRLSTVRQNLFELGARAVDTCNRLIEMQKDSDEGSALSGDGQEKARTEMIWIHPELVVRNSSKA
jgi:LacI family transcriptional regulator